jgi:hypothetical protein
MSIRNLKSNDLQQFRWKWNEENIVMMRKTIENDREQLAHFIKATSKMSFVICINRSIN